MYIWLVLLLLSANCKRLSDLPNAGLCCCIFFLFFFFFSQINNWLEASLAETQTCRTSKTISISVGMASLFPRRPWVGGPRRSQPSPLAKPIWPCKKSPIKGTLGGKPNTAEVLGIHPETRGFRKKKQASGQFYFLATIWSFGFLKFIKPFGSFFSNVFCHF